jgi:hypothetical protein
MELARKSAMRLSNIYDSDYDFNFEAESQSSE